MANIPHLTPAQPRAVEAGPSEESKHCPALALACTEGWCSQHRTCRNKTGCHCHLDMKLAFLCHLDIPLRGAGRGF